MVCLIFTCTCGATQIIKRAACCTTHTMNHEFGRKVLILIILIALKYMELPKILQINLLKFKYLNQYCQMLDTGTYSSPCLAHRSCCLCRALHTLFTNIKHKNRKHAQRSPDAFRHAEAVHSGALHKTKKGVNVSQPSHASWVRKRLPLNHVPEQFSKSRMVQDATKIQKPASGWLALPSPTRLDSV